jgi:NAD(P)-dependent dehydrogenase (short-subunit alcohol dehydrogenase family)
MSRKTRQVEEVNSSSMDSPSHGQGSDSLYGRIVMVTGAARGIGRAIAERVQAAGAQVCIVDCDREPGEALALALSEKYPERPAGFCLANLEKLEEIDAAVKHFASTHGRVDVLVNNAGIEIDKPFEEVTPSDWDRIEAVNLRAPFFLTQRMLPFFPSSGGAVINISSIHSTHAFKNATVYACSKAALIALTRNLALELAPRHIRVNALCPGYIDTHLWEVYVRSSPDPESLAAWTTALHPLGRRGVPEDVAQAALFLATNASSFITGTQIVVDGGLTVRTHP